MTGMDDYYEISQKKTNNSPEFYLHEQDLGYFPREGVYIGEFVSVSGLKSPALIPIDKTHGVCFLTTQENESIVKMNIQMLALRLALSIPSGLCKFTLYDPNGLGANLINLSSLDVSIIGEQIITNPADLRSILLDIRDSIPITIQKVLGARFAGKTLMDYNELAGEQAKSYRFIILSDFPRGVDKETGALLEYIIREGYKAGVFVIMNIDTTFPLDDNHIYNPLGLLRELTTIYQKDERFYIKNIEHEEFLNKFSLILQTEFPENEEIEEACNYVNQNLRKAKHSKVVLSNVITEQLMWSKDVSLGIEVPIGKSGPTDIQYFNLSVEDGLGQSYHHCLIGGSTGSGKTVLLHNIICNAAWLYSPNELQFMLLDFKEGTEFMIYKNLPHIKVLSIKSEVEFALNVFGFLNKEIETRGELFKNQGVSNLIKYNERVSEDKRLPRYIIIIDEFQKLFDGNMTIAGEFERHISDIGKRGRSFGINMILSTQGLGGLNLGHSLSEFGLRISMRLNSDAECNRILGSNNLAPRNLVRKGESVYCPGGNVKDNRIYQVAYLDENVITDMISKMSDAFVCRTNHDDRGFSRYLFDGESPVYIDDNSAVKQMTPTVGKIRLYIGVPFALEDEHAYYTLKRENGYNLLVIGQDSSAAMSIMYNSIEQILMQSDETCRIAVCDKTNEENDNYGKLSTLQEKYSQVKVCTSDSDISDIIDKIYGDLTLRMEGKRAPVRTCVVLYNLFNFRPARMISGGLSSDVSRKLSFILTNGPDYDIHLLVYIDTFKHYLDLFSGVLNEWRIRIELKGGEGYRLFGNNIYKSTISNSNTANIQTAEMDESEFKKVKIYNINN